LREVQQVGGPIERVRPRVAFGEVLELAAGRVESDADLAADEIERMRREIVHLEFGRHRRAHPERLRGPVRAAWGSAPTAAGSGSATRSVRAVSRADAILAWLSTLVPVVSSGSVKPLTVSRSCDASSDSLLIAAEAAFVDSVVFALISRRTRIDSVIAVVACVCSRAE